MMQAELPFPLKLSLHQPKARHAQIYVPVKHPVPDKVFMCLGHIAALLVQPMLRGFKVSIACCRAGEGMLEVVKCKVHIDSPKGDGHTLNGALVVAQQLVWALQ